MDNQTFIINQLERNLMVFKTLLNTSSAQEYLFKPTKDKWCLLEIVCHLVDEEMHDFRARVGTALDDAKFPFYPMDPIGWVTERKYIEQDYQSKIAEWSKERENSINWLRSLENPDWSSTFDHVNFGPVSAGHFLANWLAHDHIHIRQINRTKRAYLVSISNEDLNYAGKW
jgi:DinB superfamily